MRASTRNASQSRRCDPHVMPLSLALPLALSPRCLTLARALVLVGKHVMPRFCTPLPVVSGPAREAEILLQGLKQGRRRVSNFRDCVRALAITSSSRAPPRRSSPARDARALFLSSARRAVRSRYVSRKILNGPGRRGGRLCDSARQPGGRPRRNAETPKRPTAAHSAAAPREHVRFATAAFASLAPATRPTGPLRLSPVPGPLSPVPRSRARSRAPN